MLRTPPLSFITLLSLTVFGCTSDVPACLDDGGDIQYDYAFTEQWRLGALPLWTTPDAVTQAYGPPNPYPAQSELEMPGRTRTQIFGTVVDTVGGFLSPAFYLIGDTLAYPSVVSLRGRPLQTDRGLLRFGDSAGRIALLFPESARCSMQNTSDWLDLAPGGGFNAFIAVGDSVRRARISLLFAENGLVAVGVRGYEGWAAAQRQAFE